MANLRMLKKDITLVCGDLAEAIQFQAVFREKADTAKLEELLIKVADLQTTSLARANVAFDKAPKEFANKAEYNKARRAYYNKAVTALYAGLYEQRDLIIKELNASVK